MNDQVRFTGRLFRRSIPLGLAFIAVAMAIGVISVLEWILRFGASAGEGEV